MDYQRHYNALISRAKERTLTGYKEMHHVYPKCLKTRDMTVVALTPEEHYVAHQLLVKMHPDNIRILWAAINMTSGNQKQQRNNKLYGWLKRRLSEKLSGRVMSAESREKMSRNHNYDCHKNRKKHSEETKSKMSLAAKNRVFSDEHRMKLSESKKNNPTKYWLGKRRDDETLKKLRIAQLSVIESGIYNTEEYIQKQSEKMREIWYRRKLGELPMPNHKKEVCNVY